MRIGYFTNQYPAVSHTFIRREIQALETEGVEVRRYALRRAPSELRDPEDRKEETLTRYVLQSGFFNILRCCVGEAIQSPLRAVRALADAMRMGRRSDRGLLRHFAYLAEAAVLSEWCRRDKIEHLHAHFGTNPTVVALLATRLSGITFSFTAHGCEEFEKAPLMHLEYKLSRAAFAVCVSVYGKSQMMRWSNPSLWQKIHVVHCGVDVKFSGAEPPPPPDRPHFVCVGRIGEHKAQLILVAAVNRVCSEGFDCSVTLVGDGPLRPQVECEIRRLGLEDSISITGWVSGERVRQEVLAARALVLPSFAENMPVVIMEAFALERPVISTFIAGIPELVSVGQSGWLVPAGDEIALAQALKDVLSTDPQRLLQMGRVGREHVRREHDAQAEAKKMKDLFRSIALAPSPPNPLSS